MDLDIMVKKCANVKSVLYWLNSPQFIWDSNHIKSYKL